MRKKYNEEMNKQKLMAIVEEMASLDERYPNLGTPSRVREMIANGNFSIEDRPWDFLIALGYSMISLSREQNEESNQTICSLRKRMERALRYPMKWMYGAITSDVQARYLRVAARNLPQAAILRQRIPRSLRGKCPIFSWSDYAQLLYVLRRFCSCPYVLGLPELDDKYWGLISVREMRDLIASMEKPPQKILQELNQEAVGVELEALQKDLRLAQERANSLKLLGYITPTDSVEFKMLEGTARALGINMQVSGEN